MSQAHPQGHSCGLQTARRHAGTDRGCPHPWEGRGAEHTARCGHRVRCGGTYWRLPVFPRETGEWECNGHGCLRGDKVGGWVPPTGGLSCHSGYRSMRRYCLVKNSTLSEMRTEAVSQSCHTKIRNAAGHRCVTAGVIFFFKKPLTCRLSQTSHGLRWGQPCAHRPQPRVPTSTSAGCTWHPGRPPRGPPAACTASGLPRCSPRQGRRGSKLPCPESTLCVMLPGHLHACCQ